MKVFLWGLVLFLGITSAFGKRCYSQIDCDEGYCCTGGITPWIKGQCRKMAEEGELCDPNPPSTEKYFLRCPCVEGFKCEGSEKVFSNKSPVCVKA